MLGGFLDDPCLSTQAYTLLKLIEQWLCYNDIDTLRDIYSKTHLEPKLAVI